MSWRRSRAVAVNTFKETVRDRLFYIVGVFGFLLVASSAILSPLTLGAQGKIVADVGLGAMSLFGLLVVVLVGSNMLRKEVKDRTISTILTKPVTRREFLVGKYCGLSMTLLCMLGLMVAVFLLVLLTTQQALQPSLLAACYLTFLELAVINAAVLLFSTFLSPALAAFLTLSLFVIGHLTESIMHFGRVVGGGWLVMSTKALYFILPNLEVFNIRGAVVHGDPVSWQLLGLATLYGVSYAALLVLVASAVFSRKELR